MVHIGILKGDATARSPALIFGILSRLLHSRLPVFLGSVERFVATTYIDPKHNGGLGALPRPSR